MNSRRKGASTEQNGLCPLYLFHPTREGAAQSAILSPTEGKDEGESHTHFRTLPEKVQRNRLHTAERHRLPGVKRARAVKKVVHFTVHHFFLLRVLPYFVRQTRCLLQQTTEKCHSPTDWFQRTTFCRKPSEVSRRKTPCKGAKSSCTSEPVATKLRKVLPAAEYKRTRAPGCTPRNTKVEPTHCK